jgi:hypothetical protein
MKLEYDQRSLIISNFGRLALYITIAIVQRMEAERRIED